MTMAKGEHYDRLLKEFLDKGGDLSRCPFDTADYKWEEPPYDRIVANDEEWEREYENIVKKRRER